MVLTRLSDSGPATPGQRSLAPAAAFAGAVLVSAVWCLSARSAAAWLPDALGIAILLRWPSCRVPLASGLVAGMAVASLVGGQPLVPAILLGLANVVEIVAGAELVGRVRRCQASKASAASTLLLSVAVAGAAASLLGGGLAATVLTLAGGTDWSNAFWLWWTASMAGAALLLPAAVLSSRPAWAELARRPVLWEAAGLLAASTLVAAVAVLWLPFPFVAILVPLTIAAVRLPPLGAALVTSAALAIALWGDRFGLPGHAGIAVTAGQVQLSVVVAALIPISLSLLLLESHRDKLAVAASQDRFRRLFEDSAIGMAVVSLDGRFSAVNRALCQMLGYGVEELVGRSLLEVTHPDDLTLGQQTVRDSIEGRIKTFKFEKRYRRKDGSTFWALLAGSVLQDPVTGAPQALMSQVEDIDARRTAESALRESEGRWLFALETARQGVWDSNLAEDRTFYSPVWASIIGYEPAEIGDRVDAWQRYVHPDDLAKVVWADDEHLTGQSAFFEYEFRMRHKAGHWVWVLDRGQVIERAPDGRPLRMIGTHTDISVRKEAKEALRDALDRYRLLAEHGADMIMRVGPDGRRLYVSPACRTLLGFDPDEMMRMEAADTVHPEDLERVRVHWAALRPGEAPRLCAYRMRKRDGSWRWVEEIARCIDGKAETIVVLRDIEERVSARQRLEESEAGYRLLAEHGADMIFKLDRDLRRTYVSPSCGHILGYAPEDLVGSSPIEMIHPDDAVRIRQLYLDLLNGLERATAVNRIRHRDGRWLWVEVSMRRLDHAETHEPVGILGSLRDVSERKAIEDELVRAKIQAEDAARAKADFLANMSHELRTPMTGIIAAADLLLGDAAQPLTPSQRQIVDMQREAGRGLLAVVNDVLDFSKIEGGHLVVETVGVNLREVATTAVDTVRHQALSKAITLEMRVDPDLPSTISGDPIRIRQILLNFLSNAIKFTANRGSVTLSVEPRGKGRLRFAVDDTGIGINPTELTRLFERFTQADTSTTRKFGGSGLGLAISKRLAELMGGEIEVWSKAGVGSTFALSLPIEAERSVADAAAAPVPSLSRPMRVLLAEDNAMNQALIRMVLENAGCDVQAVSDGAEAVRAVLGTSGRSFDVVLMDVQMPGMDGYQATRLIRLGLNGRTLPIIALTANATTSEVERALSNAMDAHVAKPVDWSVLFATIERVTRLATPSTAALPTDFSAVTGRARSRQAIFDPHRYEDLRSTIGAERAGKLLALFQQELDQRLATVAAAPGDWDQVGQQAHALASSAAAIGFTEVFSICRGVVEAAGERAGDPYCLILVLRAAVGRAQAALAEVDVAA